MRIPKAMADRRRRNGERLKEMGRGGNKEDGRNQV
jgi:hypothetical protein